MSRNAAIEAMRIVCTIDAHFPSGLQKSGSAFIAGANGDIVTCAHVVVNDAGERTNRIEVTTPTTHSFSATLAEVSQRYDLARLESDWKSDAPELSTDLPEVGEQVVFAGKPQGVSRSSVFPGMVSAVGLGLLARPRCELIQIAGMINNGNSGGPLLEAETGEVIGIVTAKYVPLLQEIDKLSNQLGQIPQLPSNVGIGGVDFSRFVNLTVGSMHQIANVLRLVQVGTGWAVPAKYLTEIGVR